MIVTRDIGPVAVIELAQGKANTLDLELLEALQDELHRVAASPARAVVLTARGPIFSAGVDLKRLVHGRRPYIDEFLPLLADTLSKLFTLPLPVVAAVNGHAVAGGCLLACACDYRVLADGPARLGLTELRVGVPLTGPLLELVRFVVSPGRLQEVLYRAQSYSAQEAINLGLADELVPPDDVFSRALQVASDLAAIPVQSFRLTKQALRAEATARIGAARGDYLCALPNLWASPEVFDQMLAFVEATLGPGRLVQRASSEAGAFSARTLEPADPAQCTATCVDAAEKV